MYNQPFDLSYQYFPRQSQIPPYLQNHVSNQPLPMNVYLPSHPIPTMMPVSSPMLNMGHQQFQHRPPEDIFPIQTLLDNPLYPVYDFQTLNPFEMNNQSPQWSMSLPDQQPKMESNALMKYFKTQDGTFDLNKFFTTAGQLMGTLNQLQAFIKGFKFMFKS